MLQQRVFHFHFAYIPHKPRYLKQQKQPQFQYDIFELAAEYVIQFNPTGASKFEYREDQPIEKCDGCHYRRNLWVETFCLQNPP